jgi:hypothetical protein
MSSAVCCAPTIRQEAIPALSIQNWILHSTLFGIFTSDLALSAGFDLRIYELLFPFNLALMLAMAPLRVPRALYWLSAALAASGLLGILRETDTWALFLKQLIGIFILMLYAANVIFREAELSHDKNRGMDRLFIGYLRWSVAVTWLGIAECLVQSAHHHQFIRLQSIFTEPAHYSMAVVPAWYWIAWRYFHERERDATGRERHPERRSFLVLSAGMVLSCSSLGILAVALGILLLVRCRKSTMIAVTLSLLALLTLLFSTSEFFRVRVADTYLAIESSDVSNTNESTYALVSNLLVTERVFSEHPFTGNGLGSHRLSHDIYVWDVPGVEAFFAAGRRIDRLNADDAASMASRLISETGLIGLAVVLLLTARYYVWQGGRRQAFANTMLLSIFCRLLRGGHYFPADGCFFVAFYVMNSMAVRGNKPVPALRPSE